MHLNIPRQIDGAIWRTTASDTFFSQVTYAIVRSLFKNRIFLVLHPNMLRLRQIDGAIWRGVRASLRSSQSSIMSFRGVKRRGNPLNRNKNRLTIATNRISPHAYYRAENLRY